MAKTPPVLETKTINDIQYVGEAAVRGVDILLTVRFKSSVARSNFILWLEHLRDDAKLTSADRYDAVRRQMTSAAQE